ncbi:MAG TPA: methyltransferase domain-containing protein [Allosphingosinicella sp.]|nr:methyltransferase domain-containing protein [Allosphingosinicella sp.]
MSASNASRWSASDYAANAAFVPELGAPVLALLDPQPDEIILDLGCGDGLLTEKIVAAGARVIGLDASEDMIVEAQRRGIDARVGDAQAMRFDRQFDAIFSNAALHWMLDPAAVAAGVFRALKPGGRFVGEMGGQGNVALLRGAIRAELVARGYKLPAADPQFYPTVGEFSRIYGDAGFTAIDARLFRRDTDLSKGIAAWVTTFRAGWLDVAAVPEDERASIGDAVAERLADRLRRSDGSWFADYVRLRFTMRRPT